MPCSRQVSRSSGYDRYRARIVWGMKARHLWTVCIVFGAVASALGQAGTITSNEAKSLVRVVLRHENFRLSSPYCKVEQIDRDGKAFIHDYYSFSADCDYPDREGATVAFGVYVVSPRTGDVLEFNRCEWLSFPELRRLQRSIRHRTHATDTEEMKYRDQTGCNDGK
jgi:hypothetical protein